MNIHEMVDKIEVQINKKIEFAEDFRYRYGLQEAMAIIKDVMNEYQYLNKTGNDTKGTMQKTRKDVFLEKFPYVDKCNNGIPNMCAAMVGFLVTCPHFDSEFNGDSSKCSNCWNEVGIAK